MKTKNSLALFSLFLFFAGCMSLQTGGEVQWGRQALLEGKNEAALGYFYSALRGPQLCMRPGALRSRAFGCWTIRVPYRQNSPSPANLGTGAFRQSTRRYRQALSGSDLWPAKAIASAA